MCYTEIKHTFCVSKSVGLTLKDRWRWRTTSQNTYRNSRSLRKSSPKNWRYDESARSVHKSGNFVICSQYL